MDLFLLLQVAGDESGSAADSAMAYALDPFDEMPASSLFFAPPWTAGCSFSGSVLIGQVSRGRVLVWGSVLFLRSRRTWDSCSSSAERWRMDNQELLMGKLERPPWRKEAGHRPPGRRTPCCFLILGAQQKECEPPPNPTRASTRTQGRPWCASSSENWEEEEETDRMGKEERMGDMWLRLLFSSFVFSANQEKYV